MSFGKENNLMLDENIHFRGDQLSVQDKRRVKKALLDLHNLEIMAVNVYRCQIMHKDPELTLSLIAAMKNEMGHVQDYLVKLFEYKLKPAWYQWIFWLVGWFIGTFSRVRGKKAIVKAGIWTESKAIIHYTELLKIAPWDKATYQIIEKDRNDEIMHLNYWKTMLEKLEESE